MGTDMIADSFYLRLRDVTKREWGVALTPHTFRDSLATGIAIDDPEHVRAAASLLGHRNLSTTHRHYIHATSLEASRQYQGYVLQLRKQFRRGTGKP